MNAAAPMRVTDARPLAVLAALGVVVVAACWPTFVQLAQTWSGDVSYQHGWVVPLVSAWLIWRVRGTLAKLPAQPSWTAVAALGLCAIVWLIAVLADVRVVAQLAAMTMLLCCVVVVLGRRASWQIAFPLAYVLLAVPAGESLVPALMEFTADFTVGALRLTGIPVYRTGLYFVTPGGTFEVARSCSGIRYVMASVAVSALFGYLSVRSWCRRAALIVFAVAVAVLANGLRAYAIVLIAHFSDMQLAVGVDHFVYGWVMFAFVTFLIALAALRFRDRDGQVRAAPFVDTATGNRRGAALAWGAAALLVVLAGGVARGATGSQTDMAPSRPLLPLATAGWSGPAPDAARWRPRYPDAVHLAAGRYQYGDAAVDVYVAAFRPSGSGGGDVAGSGRGVLTGTEEAPARIERRRVALANSAEQPVGVAHLPEPNLHDTRVVWLWYEIGPHVATTSYEVKLRELLGLLRGRSEPRRAYVLSASSGGDDGAAAERALTEFFLAHAAALSECAGAPGEAPGCTEAP